MRDRLAYGRPKQLLLIMYPTTQKDKVVMLTVGVWYRGRALPIAWMTWPANQPLEGDSFWQRVESLLDTVAELLPVNIPVIWIADRAFGSPSFTDLVTARGWHYVVRVLKTTRCQTVEGLCRQVSQLVSQPGRRAKMRGIDAVTPLSLRSLISIVPTGLRLVRIGCPSNELLGYSQLS